MQKINHGAIWTVVVLAQLIPAGWYGLFQEPWMRYNDLSEAYITEQQTATPFVVSIIASAIFAYVLAWVFRRMQIDSALGGFTAAVLMGFAFLLLPLMVQNLFSFRPYPLTWIDGGASLVIWAVAGLLLGGWRKYAA